MKISVNWLKSLLDIPHSPEEIAVLLTGAGLEVEGMEKFESISGGLNGLVVGHITECVKHPDADRLSLTKVDIGQDQLLSIVCGAPNVAAGQKVIVATVGARLYPVAGEPFDIKKSKIRGAASEGMICAEDEIGLGQSHVGIMVLPPDTPTGMPAADYFKIETDTILEIGLTPNRSDAASHLGVARDLAAVLNTRLPIEKKAELNLNGLAELPPSLNLNKVKIGIVDPEGCRRYSGIVITGVKVADSPDWLKNRLKSIGVRPINNIVDITNFVLHELGQPLHAFDLDKITGRQVIVRRAAEAESFTTLDGVQRSLSGEDLVIADSTSVMCLAGVFGGIGSGVTAQTQSVFLESACFDPGFIRRTSKKHGLKTDASFRFERGTDPEMTVKALVRAANLVLELAGGVTGMDITDVYPEPLTPYKVAFSYTNCNELIGKDIDRALVRSILQELGMVIESEGNDGLLLHVPRYKTDVTREADVIEEVMRIYGYNNVESSRSIAYTAANVPPNHSQALENRVGTTLEGFGFSEIMSLSLSSGSYYPDSTPLVKVLSPLSSDLNVLRANMLFSGLETIAYNANRKNADLKLFEIGKTYSQEDKEGEIRYTEEKHLTLFATGRHFQENPHGLKQEADFYFLKSVLLRLFEKCGLTKTRTTEAVSEDLAYGLAFTLNGKSVAECGLVAKHHLKKFDIRQPVFYARVSWEPLVKAYSRNVTVFSEIPKFPSVRRDLALLIDRSVKYSQVEEIAFATEKKFLQEVNLFDVYEGEKLGNKKSYAVSFTLLNHEATLTDKQIEGVMDKLISNYKEKLGAELR